MKTIEGNANLRDTINKTVIEVGNIVGSSMGPKGRNTLIHNKGKKPFITKDGTTICDAVQYTDPTKNAIAEIIKQAASVTAAKAGDGTTTSTVLVKSLITNSNKFILAGSNPTDIKKGMDRALEIIKKELDKNSKSIDSLENIEHIATISANGDKQIGKLLAMAVDKVGRDGAVTIEESKIAETLLDIVEGFNFDSGFFSPQFITDERKLSMRFDNPLILVTDYMIDRVDQLMPVLTLTAQAKRPLIIVTETLEGQALAALILNSVRGTMQVGAIKAPGYGEERRETLKDLAISVGAEFITSTSNLKLETVKLNQLGTCKTVEATKNWSTFVSGAGKYEKISERVEQIKTEIQQTKNIQEAETLQQRITRLSSGVAIIKVGGTTEVEVTEKKHRVEDALEAIKSAQEEGIIPGGGITLLKLAFNSELKREALESFSENDADQRLGIQILFEAIKEPFQQISSNAGLNAEVIYSKINMQDSFAGYDFAKEIYVENMYDAGIIDPVKVTKVALENAVSVASTLLTTEFAILETN